MLRSVVIVVAALLAATPALSAQQAVDTTRRASDSTRAALDSVRTSRPALPQGRAVRDSFAPPISARRAFFYSALIPGLGQAKLDRGRAGGLFMATELVSITMAIKAAGDLRFARAHARDSVVATYAYNADGTVQTDPTTGQPVVATYAINRYGGSRVRSRRTHLEDWYALLMFNHLIAGAEAFVSAQLWDFPARVAIQARPRGADVSLSIRW